MLEKQRNTGGLNGARFDVYLCELHLQVSKTFVAVELRIRVDPVQLLYLPASVHVYISLPSSAQQQPEMTFFFQEAMTASSYFGEREQRRMELNTRVTYLA